MVDDEINSLNSNSSNMVDRDKNDRMDQQDRDEIYSKVIRAGKRTYFFDVKATRGEDYFLTITESKKVYDMDGNSHYEKHKIFLYKEDFDKFAMGFDDALRFISALLAGTGPDEGSAASTRPGSDSVEFEDLEEKK